MYSDLPLDTFLDSSLCALEPQCSKAPMSQHPRCGYPSKVCSNFRAIKRDGAFHRFCEYHRERANYNQRRLERKKREAKKAERAGVAPAGECQRPASPTDVSFVSSPLVFDPIDTVLVDTNNDEDLQSLMSIINSLIASDMEPEVMV